MTSVAVTYRYAGASDVHADAGGTTSAGIATTDAGTFLDATAERADVLAASLLTVGQVAATRFYEPPNAAARQLWADPIITTGDGTARFESLSLCCGVAARLDVLPGGLDASLERPGTTNVDLGPGIRRLLAGVRRPDPMHVVVGDSGLTVRTLDGEAHERTITLPDRWVRSLAELQVLASRMVLRAEVTGVQARAFWRTLPRTTRAKDRVWVAPARDGLRIAGSGAPGGSRGTGAGSAPVAVGGPERLRLLEPLLRHAKAVRVYGPDPATADPDAPASSWWELDLPHARLGFALSAWSARGFSGEGALLDGLLDGDGDAVLAAHGRRGYDLAEGRYYDRLLPFGRDVLADQPRLEKAMTLVDDGAVRLEGSRAVVRGTDGEHLVVEVDGVLRCTCPWGAGGADRGPCAHLLAVRLARTAAATGAGR